MSEGAIATVKGWASHAQPLLPIARAVRWKGAYYLARGRAELPIAGMTQPRDIAFVIGCGRSGTTLTGAILGRHPDSNYLFEPYHLWAAVDPQTDASGLYVRGPAHCILGAEHWSEFRQQRFDRLFQKRLSNTRRPLIVEKTPINSMRIEYLRRFAPDALFINIVRNGRDVARSIEERSNAGSYRIAGRNPYNQWWGVADKKWQVLASDIRSRDYLSAPLAELKNDLARGACEWIASLEEVELSREALGNKLLDVRYESLTADPVSELRRMAEFLGIQASDSWLSSCEQYVRPARSRCSDAPFKVPVEIEGPFLRWMDRLGYV